MKGGLAKKFVQNGVIRAEDEKIYEYGLKVAAHTVIGYAVMAALAGLLRAWDIFFIFLPGYLPLRRYAGGFHERTRLRCLLVSQLMFVFTVFAVRFAIYVQIDSVVIAAAAAAAAAAVLLKAPVASVNRPISGKARGKYRKIALIILTVLICAVGILLITGLIRAALVLTMALCMEAVLLLVPERTQKRKAKEAREAEES